MPTHIHTHALVDAGARLGTDVEIGPFAIVEADVEIGDHTRIAAHAILRKGTRVGKDSLIDSFTVVGGNPNLVGFDPETPSRAVIGDRATIRESVTIHRSIRENGETRIGDDCFLMPTSHIAHDCFIGDKVTLANGAQIAGHVTIGSHVFFGGLCGVHQFCRIGDGVMVAGNAEVSRDIAPFVTIAHRDDIHGLNLVGLRRRKIPRETILELKDLYRKVLMASGNPEDSARELPPARSSEGRAFLDFFQSSQRGYAKSSRT